MKVWSIGLLLLLLLLLSTAAIAKTDVLVVDKDESLGSLSDKADTFATSIKREDEPGKTQDEMSWEAAQELLDAVKEFGNITHGPVAIYRDDLPLDYVAYWLVELNSSHYITISSGPETGDYMLSSQGPLPSPITELDLTAEKYDKDCAKYLMMTPDGEMMCRDKTGKIVATTAEDLLLPGNMFDNDPNFERAHRYIDMHITKLAALWAARASEVAKKAIWGDKQVTKSTESNEVTGFRENYVAPGGVIRVPVDGDTVSVKVKYTAEHKTETIEDVAQIQKAVCQMISTCNVDDDCSINLSKKKSVLHLNYMELEISKDTPAVFNGRRSVDFQLRVEQATGSVIVRHYSLDTTKHRQKRSKEYKDVSSWTEISIPDEHHFPSYWQHKTKKGCYVGCGPVAWAMVFGYYDRRSHSQPSIYGSGSQDLYRCGSDGTTGDKSCVAPQYSYTSDARVKSYFEQIAKTLGTWCIFSNGATPAFKMDNVEGFFKERQTSGSPTIQQTSNNWKIFARDSIAIKTREWIRNGWPVVIGTTESNVFQWHYPVATKYRYRTQKYRSCVTIIWKICGNWATETQYDMFTHQGQPYNMTMWRPMKLHYAAIASY